MKNYSKQREAILTKIRSTHSHPTAEWLFTQLKGDYPSLSLATVYRNLNVFKEEGLIKSLGVVDGQERFDSNVKAHRHFICESCGAVSDTGFKDNKLPLEADLSNLPGYQLKRMEVVFYGLCKNCNK
ncbi:MAG: transcriptional repressor [Spirochaetaceae bacterium]|nr:transcriptional repressor [Spirochaetaceae bacterium]